MSQQQKLTILLLANYYRADHDIKLSLYKKLNSNASLWNTYLFSELKNLDLNLHIVQFYPVKSPLFIKEGNVNFHYLPAIPKIDSFTSLVKKIRFQILSKKINPDITHGIGSEHGYALPAVLPHIPAVITIHGYLKNINRLPGHTSLLKKLFLEREEKVALHKASTIIAINQFMKGQFIESGLPPEKIEIVANALNPIYFSNEGNQPRDIDILMVGTLHQLKNHDRALQIFAAAKTTFNRSLKVMIAGAPTILSEGYYQELLAYKESNKLTDVVFTGAVPPAKLKKIYQRTRVFLHISAFETDSAVLAEARVSGAIPVVNPVAALAFWVNNGKDGFHIDITKTEESARKLITILDAFDISGDIIERSSKKAINERQPKAVAMSTYNVYKKNSGK